MNRDELVKRWFALPDGHQDALAGNFFPELVTDDTPSPILRAIEREIADREDTVAVDAGKMSFTAALQRSADRGKDGVS